MVSPEIINITKRFVEKVKSAGIKVDQVYIFGSFVKGTADRWSDIDIAIVVPKFKGDKFDQKTELIKIAMGVDSRIEPLVFETSSFVKDNWIPIIYEIKRHGLPIKVAA